MPLATLTNTGMKSDKTQSAMRGANKENFNPVINGRSIRQPLRTIYLYSVARRAFTVRHPLFAKLQIQGCEQGQRWVRCASVPDPVPQVCPDQERGGTRVDDNDGWMVAIDMLNPGNLTFDPYAGSTNPDYFANRGGSNLMAEGVWPSLNEEPTEEEIKRAESARDSHYRFLAKEASRLAAVSTRNLNEFLQQYPDTHIAMDMLGLTAPWHTSNVVKATCPNCGDDIKAGVAYHVSNGRDCVLDWKRYYEIGRCKKEDVPPGHRWQGFGRIAEPA